MTIFWHISANECLMSVMPSPKHVPRAVCRRGIINCVRDHAEQALPRPWLTLKNGPSISTNIMHWKRSPQLNTDTHQAIDYRTQLMKIPVGRRMSFRGSEEEDERIIHVARLGEKRAHASAFCDNSVKNSKYTLVTFLPRSIFEQFRRLANVYFLAMGFLMLLGTYTTIFETPLTAFSTLFPLTIVLGISMAQEAFTDVKRHRSDDETNNRMTKVTSWNTGAAVTSESVRWRDVHVGDLLYVSNKQPLPADMVILATSESENICYIETSSIDGETNLKLRRAINYLPTHDTPLLDPADVIARVEEDQAVVRCELPNMKIESFTGTFCISHKEEHVSSEGAPQSGDFNKVIPIDNENVLLRGAMLRNTRWAVGVVVYTGKDTKLQRNSRHAPSKLSKIDVAVNKAIYMVFLTDVILVLVSTFLLLQFEDAYFSTLTYLGFYSPGLTPGWAMAVRPDGMDWESRQSTFIQGFLTFIVLFNNFVPISMYVTMEMCTYAHLYFINEDLSMHHEESDTPAKARSNIVTDLGQIQYVFSDKTGTLTQNVMRFKRASVQGKVYGAPVLMTEANATLPYINVQGLNRDAAPGSPADDFLKILALCHTVVLESDAMNAASDNSYDKDALTYQAESPDEKALVEFAQEAAYELIGRTTQQITLKINGKIQSWTPLAVNKFDSDRKRMSIVVQDGEGRVRLLCKGADTAMLQRGTCGSVEAATTMVDHLKIFAQEGLRTLVLGYRDLTPAMYAEWFNSYREASAAARDRADLMSKVADNLEKDLTIVGLTAIEDKLQDGVPDTIADLATGGVKFCVLTGDKMETAINIGYSCKVLREGQLLLQLTSGTSADIEAGLARLYKAVIDKKGVNAEFLKLKAKPTRSFSRCGQATRRAQDVASAWDVLLKHFPTLSSPTLGMKSQCQKIPSHSPHISSPDAPLPPVHHPIHVRFTKAARKAMVSKTQAVQGPQPDDILQQATRHTHRRLSRAYSHVTDFAFVMEGPALVYVFSHPGLKVILFEIMKASSAVIACRVSPKQKAQLVRLVKEEVSPTPVTLAIGDGANDVNMIQEADVGIGISGNEGQQAVNASDFSIAQFRFLKRLLLVHGRWSYRRLSKVVLYSFYKNIVLVMCLFFFLFKSGFSGTSIFEDFVLSAYNFFLGLPILTLGIFDQDLSADFVMANPSMYISGRKNLDLSAFQVGKWILSALLDGFLVYFLTIWTLPSGGGIYNQVDYYVLGLAMYGVLILSMNWRLLFEFKTILRPALLPKAASRDSSRGGCQPRANCSFCGWSLWVWLGSVLSFFLVTLVYSNLLSFAPFFYGVAIESFSMVSVWLQLLLIPVICVAIVALYTFLADEFAPSPVQLGVEKAYLLVPTSQNQKRHMSQLEPVAESGILTEPPAAMPQLVELPTQDEDLEQGDTKPPGTCQELSVPAN